MGKKRWRFFGIFVYGFFAFMELGDLFGLVSGQREGQGTMRLVILAVLAAGIVLASLATASALLSGAGWGRVSARVTAALFFIYGAVQITSGFLLKDSSQAGLIFAGIMYILLGVVANWIGAMAQPAKLRTV